jgi:hypothetical protein
LRLEAGAEVHMENDRHAVRVYTHLHCLRWPTIRPVQAYLEGLQPHMLVVASGERQQGFNQLVAVLLEGQLEFGGHPVRGALLPAAATLSWFRT